MPAALVLLAGSGLAAPVPHLDGRGQAAYADYLQAEGHRAFAIPAGGAWAWKEGEASAEAAEAGALADCRRASALPCVTYSVDGRVVFDGKSWPRLWRPYPSPEEARRAATGTARGERFFDLALKSPAGKPMKLSDLRGSVVVLHFWGSWCPPCRRELPAIAALQRHLPDASGIRLVLLQVREGPAAAQGWARQQKLDLPLHDSGAGEGDEGMLRLADGTVISDRSLAPAFPATYVLDRQGIVVHAHVGPITDWPGHLPFLRDLAVRSAR